LWALSRLVIAGHEQRQRIRQHAVIADPERQHLRLDPKKTLKEGRAYVVADGR